MLSSSSYRHQTKAISSRFAAAHGAFFLAVGMSLDLSIAAAEPWFLLSVLVATFRGVVLHAARALRRLKPPGPALTSMFPQGAARPRALCRRGSDGRDRCSGNSLFTTKNRLSMALTPFLIIVTDRLLRSEASMDGVDLARDLKGRILVIGFGRFGQIASQLLLSKGVSLSVIDRDPDRIRDAARFGFKVFFGDGTRLDTLHHSGARTADAIMICVDDRKSALQIVELAQHEFPQAKLLVRSYDRGHAVELIRAGVDYQIRETVESAYLMGAEGLRALGFSELEVEEAAADIRQRDAERLSEQVQGDIMSGLDRLHTQPVPEPLGKVPAAERQ